MKRKQTTFEKSLKQAIIMTSIFGTCAVLVFSLYYTMDTVIERAFVLILGVVFLFPLIPIAISFIVNFIVNSGSKQADDKFENNKSNSKITPAKTNTEIEKPKLKIVSTEGYQEFNNLLKASVQNKLLDRQTILQLKSELRYKLGTHVEVYKDFKFENDLHELYVLSKSSVLTKEDYKYLSEFISNNLIFPKEA
jgi:uncharacterized MnhB-related membrane protein